MPVFCWLLSHTYFNLEKQRGQASTIFFVQLMNTLGPRGPRPFNVEVRSVGGAICFETLLSQHWRGGSNNHPCQISISVRKILTRVVREFVGKGFRVETLCKNVETHVRETHASILKGPRRARSQTYTYFWIILARLGRHKSNMKSMHARKL